MQDLAEIFVRPLADELARASAQWTDDWLTEEGASALPRENGRVVARYGRRMLVVSWVSIIGLFIISTFILFAAPGTAKWFSSPFVVFLTASMICLLDAKYLRYEFNRDELHVRTFWKGRRLIPWSAVQSMGYSVWGHQTIHAGIYGNVLIHRYLQGSQALIDLTRAKLQERYRPKICGR